MGNCYELNQNGIRVSVFFSGDIWEEWIELKTALLIGNDGSVFEGEFSNS